MNIFKTDGTLKARAKLLADLTEERNIENYHKWLEVKQLEYEVSISALSFDEWLKESAPIIVGTQAITLPDGTTQIVDIIENKLIREFIPSTLTEIELDIFLSNNKEYRNYLRKTMTVTISTGKTFDADLTARINMESAIRMANKSLNTTTPITQTLWRLADGSDSVVTLAELDEACDLALTTFGKITGVL